MPEEELRAFFGERLAGSLIRENENDCLAAVTKEALAQKWGEIRGIIAALPEEAYLYGLLEKIGAKRTLEGYRRDRG